MTPEKYIEESQRLCTNLMRVSMRISELETLWSGATTGGNGALEQEVRLKLHAMLDQKLDLDAEMIRLRSRFIQP